MAWKDEGMQEATAGHVNTVAEMLHQQFFISTNATKGFL